MVQIEEVVEAQMVQAVAMFPPRADAIVTLITSDDQLPGAQTLLYTVKKCLGTRLYPCELVVMVTPRVSARTRGALWPALCTRILEVDALDLPKGINKQVSQKDCKPWDDDC